MGGNGRSSIRSTQRLGRQCDCHEAEPDLAAAAHRGTWGLTLNAHLSKFSCNQDSPWQPFPNAGENSLLPRERFWIKPSVFFPTVFGTLVALSSPLGPGCLHLHAQLTRDAAALALYQASKGWEDNWMKRGVSQFCSSLAPLNTGLV